MKQNIFEIAEKKSWREFCDEWQQGFFTDLHFYFFEHIVPEIATRIKNELDEWCSLIENIDITLEIIYNKIQQQEKVEYDDVFWSTHYYLKIHGIDPSTASCAEIFSFFKYQKDNLENELDRQAS